MTATGEADDVALATLALLPPITVPPQMAATAAKTTAMPITTILRICFLRSVDRSGNQICVQLGRAELPALRERCRMFMGSGPAQRCALQHGTAKNSFAPV